MNAEKIANLIKEKVENCGVELVDLELLNEDQSTIVRIYIDSENGIDLDDCQKVSRVVEDDIDEVFVEKFLLEVSSPGLERPLKNERDFERNVGEKVTIKLRERIGKKIKLNGKIEKVNDGIVLLKLNNSEIKEIPLTNIKKGKLIFEI